MLLLVQMFKYMAHSGQEQENQIVFGKPLILSTFCEVGGGGGGGVVSVH